MNKILITGLVSSIVAFSSVANAEEVSYDVNNDDISTYNVHRASEQNVSLDKIKPLKWSGYVVYTTKDNKQISFSEIGKYIPKEKTKTSIPKSPMPRIRYYTGDSYYDNVPALTTPSIASFNLNSNVSIGGTYKEHKYKSDMNSGIVQVAYRGATGEEGSWGLFVSYNQLSKDADDFSALGKIASRGLKGYHFGGSYSPIKNLTLHGSLFTGQNDDKQDVKALFGGITFYF